MNKKQCKAQALVLLDRSGICISDKEKKNLKVLDFGLNHPAVEGAQLIDIVRSSKIRITILVLLPNQTLPEHMHPAYDGQSGKEEHVRILSGSMTVYRPGISTNFSGKIPIGKEQWYQNRNGIVLKPGDSLFVEPQIFHWFQAGESGCVSFGFYTAVDESRNIFSDPSVSLKI